MHGTCFKLKGGISYTVHLHARINEELYVYTYIWRERERNQSIFLIFILSHTGRFFLEQHL